MPQAICSPRDLIGQILGQPIEWVAWRELAEDERRRWSDDALALLGNRVFQALCGRSKLGKDGIATVGEYVKLCIETIARDAKSYEEVERIRMLIVAAERFKEMVEEMVIMKDEPSKEGDLNAPI